MSESARPPMPPAALMIGARLVNMTLSLVAIPVLIRYLGGSGFAAWAICLALAAGFSMLELGMAQTSVRFLAVAGRDGLSRPELLGQVWLLLGLSYAVGLLAVLAFCGTIAAWLGLPDTPLLAAKDVIVWIFAAVALRTFLQTGDWVLFAARRFAAASAVSLLQPFASNIAAMLTAWQTGRLDATLIAFWGAQLWVVAIAFFLNRRECVPRFGAQTCRIARLRELGHYGLTNQMEGWARFVNLQFDKFLIAGLVGLWAVGPYEVASRAVAAMRSVPASGADTFLPVAIARGYNQDDAWNSYLASTQLAAYGACVFILAPLAVAPVFLYAWTGEMGYLGRWVFAALSLGAAANILALPALTLAQAEGHSNAIARAAAVSVLVNAPLSLLLVLQWGLAGAAAGTGLAMGIGAGQLICSVHNRFKRPLRDTAKILGRFWPAVLVCLCWGALTYTVFDSWFATLDAAIRFSRFYRAYPGLIAIGVYVACLASLLAVQLHYARSASNERPLLDLLPGWRRLRRAQPRK